MKNISLSSISQNTIDAIEQYNLNFYSHMDDGNYLFKEIMKDFNVDIMTGIETRKYINLVSYLKSKTEEFVARLQSPSSDLSITAIRDAGLDSDLVYAFSVLLHQLHPSEFSVLEYLKPSSKFDIDLTKLKITAQANYPFDDSDEIQF